MEFKINFARGLRFGFGVVAFVAVMGWAGQPSWTSFGSAAQAQTLTQAQSSAVQTAVANALAGVDTGLTGNALATAIQNALGGVVNTYSLDGPAAISAIVSDAIQDGASIANIVGGVLPAAVNAGLDTATVVSNIEVAAVGANVSAGAVAEAVITVQISHPTTITLAAVGSGLGRAATTLNSTNPNAASAILATVTTNGNAQEASAFSSATSGTQIASNGAVGATGATGAIGPIGGSVLGGNNSGQNSQTGGGAGTIGGTNLSASVFNGTNLSTSVSP
jgi:hypothetical protein